MKKIDDESEEEIIRTVNTNAAINAINTSLTDAWQYDNGASSHTTNKLGKLTDITKVNIKVEGHDKSITTCTLAGTVIFRHQNRKIILKNVLYNPSFSNLVSAQRIGPRQEIITDNDASIKDLEGKVLFKGIVEGGKIWIAPDNNNIEINAVNATELMRTHERYGHISLNAIALLHPEIRGKTITCKAVKDYSVL